MFAFLIRKRTPRLRAQPGRLHLAAWIATKQLTKSMRVRHVNVGRVSECERPSVRITYAGCADASRMRTTPEGNDRDSIWRRLTRSPSGNPFCRCPARPDRPAGAMRPRDRATLRKERTHDTAQMMCPGAAPHCDQACTNAVALRCNRQPMCCARMHHIVQGAAQRSPQPSVRWRDSFARCPRVPVWLPRRRCMHVSRREKGPPTRHHHQ